MSIPNSYSDILKNRHLPTTEFYSQLIDSLHDYSIFTVDNDAIINSWSSGSTAIFGYLPEEVIGKHFDLIFTSEDKKNGIPKSEIQKALKEGKAINNRWHIRKNRNEFYGYGLVYPYTDLVGEILGYVNILCDLTERKLIEDALTKHVKELEELNSHKESIFAILSHDLRSPLRSIVSITEFLKSNVDKIQPAELKQMLILLNEASKDELNMLDYLLVWARIKYASQAFAPVKINLNQYVLKVFDTLNQTAAVNQIKLQNQIEQNITAYADGKMILSVLQNIISNAIQHSPKGGKITITAQAKEKKIIIEINDAGIGMSKQIQQKLFMPQISKLSRNREENNGAGIGLLLAKSLLEKNNGQIWVESTEGEGTSFYFSLPINKPSVTTNTQHKTEFVKNE